MLMVPTVATSFGSELHTVAMEVPFYSKNHDVAHSFLSFYRLRTWRMRSKKRRSR